MSTQRSGACPATEHRKVFSHGALLALAACCLLAAPAAAQPPGSPLANSEARSAGYPDASRWPGGELERVESGRKLPETTGQSSAALAGDGAALVADKLPAGITLTAGAATQVMAETGSETGSIAGPAAPAGIDAEQLGRGAASPGAGARKLFLTYRVQYRGLPVAKYSDVLAIVGAEGELLYLRKRNLPTALDATQPTVQATAAGAAARRHMGAAAVNATADAPPVLEVWVEPSLRGQLAWTLTLRSPSLTQPMARQYWVAAVGEPRILHWEDLIYHTHAGLVSGTVWEGSPLQPTQNHAVSDLRVNRNPGAGVQLTNAEGRYGYTNGGGVATLSAGPAGPFSVVDNVPGAEITASASGLPANPVNFNFGAATPAELAQTTAFYWTTATFNFARSILDPLPGRPFANLPTRVNIASSCNAFWNGSSTNFFAAGGSCPNTAYSDVVAHEYGHGIDHWRGGILDGSYSEGFGDAIAILLTRQPCLGRDFLGAGTCLRPATAVDLWPPASPEVHEQGKRYGQFVWRLVDELKKTFSADESFQLAQKLVLASAAANPSSIPNAVQLAFVADDTDGNLANGTPHCRELAAAADSRNLPHPACPPDRLGYVWANNQAAASYTPLTTYSYNSAGGPITITRSAVGTYQVKFAGLGGGSLSGGNVQVTPYGAGTADCRVLGWGSGGADFLVNVRCQQSSGTAADSLYTVLVNWR